MFILGLIVGFIVAFVFCVLLYFICKRFILIFQYRFVERMVDDPNFTSIYDKKINQLLDNIFINDNNSVDN